MTFLMHNPDPLMNLSYFESDCRVCGRHHVESVVDERETAWVACECGHVLQAENKWRWH